MKKWRMIGLQEKLKEVSPAAKAYGMTGHLHVKLSCKLEVPQHKYPGHLINQHQEETAGQQYCFVFNSM